VHPQSNIASYGDLSLAILGKYGFRIQQAFLAFLQLGVCCIYVSFISNNILSLLPNSSESDGSSGTDEGAETMMKLRAIMCGLAAPISVLVFNLRTIKQLSTVSYIACALLGVGMLVILFLCSVRLVANDYEVLNASINLATGDTSADGHGFLFRNIRMSQVSLFVASTAYSYEGIGMVLPIENAMRDRSSFGSCLLVAMSIVSSDVIAI
jgi:amino acid permease